MVCKRHEDGEFVKSQTGEEPDQPLTEARISLQPIAVGLKALRDRSIVKANKFAHHALQDLAILRLIPASRALLWLQTRDGDAMTLPDNDSAGVHRIVQP